MRSTRLPGPVERRTSGFTVTELLVATALLGVVLLALLTLTRGSLRFTDLNNAVSISVEQIADAEGYLSDNIRQAKAVLLNAYVLNETGSDTAYDCNGATTNRCIGILSPVVDADQDSQPIVNFDLVIFAIDEIGTLYADEGLPRGFDGSSTLVLLEYRVRNVCASTCATIAGANIVDRSLTDPVGFILGNLSDTDADGSDVTFFDVEGTNLLMNFVVRADSSVSSPYILRETPVALQVAVRE